jgi:hypothetical protein
MRDRALALDICWSVIVSSCLTQQVKSTSDILHHFLNMEEGKQEKDRNSTKYQNFLSSSCQTPYIEAHGSRSSACALRVAATFAPQPQLKPRPGRFCYVLSKCATLSATRDPVARKLRGTRLPFRAAPPAYLSWMLPTNDGSLTLPPASPSPAMGRL